MVTDFDESESRQDVMLGTVKFLRVFVRTVCIDNLLNFNIIYKFLGQQFAPAIKSLLLQLK